MGVIKELFNKCVNYAKANPVHAIVLAAIAALILIVLVIIVVRLIKRSRAKKRLKKQAQQQATPTPVKPATTSQVTKPAPTKEEEEAKKAAAEEARRAVFERLEQQRLEAEREEAELKAKEEAEKKAKEEAEKKVAEEVAVAEKKKSAPKTTKTAKPAEKKPTKKATPAKKAEEPKPEQQPAPVLYDEMKDAHEEDKVWYDENETDKAAKYSGKWLICRVLTDDAHEEEMYFFELHASNGEKLLSSEEYTSYAGALRGIETHKANILKGNFKVTISKKGDYIFKLLSGKNLLLCMGENYPTRARCESAIESAKRFAQTAVIDENVVDHIVKVPVEDDGEIQALPEGYNGKWIINAREGADGENIYYFELFANNGEKLLSSEDYTSYVGAVNGIQTHKTNIEKGNFRITLTKRGDYIYKLLNGNGQLLCLGEHYKTKRLCQNAVESVKRFAMNSPVLADSSLTR